MADLSKLIDDQRLAVYPRILLAIYAVGVGYMWWSFDELVDPTGKGFGYDFITFWSAGWLTLGGNGVGAFDAEAILAAQNHAVEGVTGVYLWHYPPTFQLIAAGLALLPYVMSYFVFVGFSLAAFLAAVRSLVPWRHAGTLLLALPGVFLCAVYGQNSLISAALFAAAMANLERRPAVAGVFIGLLAFKPQLGILIPFVLVIAGQWRVIYAAAATVLVYCGLATALLGVELWIAFVSNLSVVKEVLESGLLPWSKIPSAFIFLRMLGVGQELAYVVHSVVAVVAIAGTLFVWWRVGVTPLSWATLICGTMLVPPYTFNYEFVILTIPLVIILNHLVQRGGGVLWWEKVVIASIVVGPLLMGPIVELVSIQLGFLVLLATFAWTVWLALLQTADRPVVIPGLPGGLKLAPVK